MVVYANRPAGQADLRDEDGDCVSSRPGTGNLEPGLCSRISNACLFMADRIAATRWVEEINDAGGARHI